MSITTFGAALKMCGLTISEASEFLDVRPDTVKNWSQGRRTVAPFAWEKLRALYARQQQAAQAAIDLIAEQHPDEIALAENGPRQAEWPSTGAHLAVLARVALETDLPVIIE